MRKTFAALAAITLMFIGNIASANMYAPLNSCASSVAANSGSAAYVVEGSYYNECSCYGAAMNQNGCGRTTTYRVCGFNEVDMGFNTAGLRCCINLSAPCLVGGEFEEEVTEVKSSAASESLSEVFSNDQRSYYWGYVNSTSRSPNAGRSNAPRAALDACLSHGTADLIDSTYPGDGYSAWSECTSKCSNTSNGGNANHCSANSGAVCNDRCDCRYPGFSTCNGL